MTDSVLSLMTLEEKMAYIGGDRNFLIRSVPRLNLGEVYMSNATQGVHIRKYTLQLAGKVCVQLHTPNLSDSG